MLGMCLKQWRLPPIETSVRGAFGGFTARARQIFGDRLRSFKLGRNGDAQIFVPSSGNLFKRMPAMGGQDRPDVFIDQCHVALDMIGGAGELGD